MFPIVVPTWHASTRQEPVKQSPKATAPCASALKVSRYHSQCTTHLRLLQPAELLYRSSRVTLDPLKWPARLAGPQQQDLYATRSLAADPGLDLPFTVISISRPSASKSRMRRSMEKPVNFPWLSADTFG